MNLLIVAIIVNSALYIAMVFTAGLVTHNAVAYMIAIMTAGVCYLSYSAQVIWPKQNFVSLVTVLASIVLGVLAGVSLLIGG